jgi:hypothetical protein
MSATMYSPPQIAEPEILSGERLQACAGVSVVTAAKLRFHRSLPPVPLAHFSADLEPNCEALAALDAARIIFVYGDLADAFFARILPLLTYPFVLITHNSDAGAECRHRELLGNPVLVHWFAQNAAFEHPKLTALPIGIANAQWKHGDTAALARIAARHTPKRPGLYVNFKTGTNPAAREPLLAALREKPFAVMGGRMTLRSRLDGMLAAISGRRATVETRPLAYPAYLADMARWRYCVSPPGNGIDCHRTWEALYLGVIPVALPAPGRLLDGLPCIAAGDLASLTMEQLESRLTELRGPFAWEKLTVSYWHQRIQEAARGL